MTVFIALLFDTGFNRAALPWCHSDAGAGCFGVVVISPGELLVGKKTDALRDLIVGTYPEQGRVGFALIVAVQRLFEVGTKSDSLDSGIPVGTEQCLGALLPGTILQLVFHMAGTGTQLVALALVGSGHFGDVPFGIRREVVFMEDFSACGNLRAQIVRGGRAVLAHACFTVIGLAETEVFVLFPVVGLCPGFLRLVGQFNQIGLAFDFAAGIFRLRFGDFDVQRELLGEFDRRIDRIKLTLALIVVFMDVGRAHFDLVIGQLDRCAPAVDVVLAGCSFNLVADDDVDRVKVLVLALDRFLEIEGAGVVVDFVIRMPRQILHINNCLTVQPAASLDDHLLGVDNDFVVG